MARDPASLDQGSELASELVLIADFLYLGAWTSAAAISYCYHGRMTSRPFSLSSEMIEFGSRTPCFGLWNLAHDFAGC